MFMVHGLDIDKEPSCLWKPWGWVGEKCGEEMPSAGTIAVCTGTLCLASSILHRPSAGSNCSERKKLPLQRSAEHHVCLGQSWLDSLSSASLTAPTYWKADECAAAPPQTPGRAAPRLLQIESIPARLSVPGFLGVSRLSWFCVLFGVFLRWLRYREVFKYAFNTYIPFLVKKLVFGDLLSVLHIEVLVFLMQLVREGNL